MKYVLYSLFYFFPLWAFGQYDLTVDSSFFRDQAELYQKWLDKSGLGKVLRVYTIEAKPQELSLYLAFHTEESELCLALWDRLKADFEKRNPITLEQELFYKMVHLMEVRQEMANVQIYDIYDTRRNYYFFVGIYFDADEKKVRTQQKITTLKGPSREIVLDSNTFDGQKTTSFEEIRKRYTKSAVFDTIFKYSKERYEKRKCDLRYPEVRILESDEVLRFEVIDLCKEVLEDEENHWICEVLKRFSHKCNWIKREKLEFTVTYTTTAKGIKIGVKVDGKYGSGYYDKVRRGGYHDMDLDFDDYLENYADRLKLEFKKAILDIRKV